MNTEEEFDKTFRQSFEIYNSPVNPKNWQLASDSLDLYFKRKRRKTILIWLASISVVAILTFWQLTQNQQNQVQLGEQVVSPSKALYPTNPELQSALNSTKSKNLEATNYESFSSNKKTGTKNETMNALSEKKTEIGQPSETPWQAFKVDNSDIEEKPIQNDGKQTDPQSEFIVTTQTEPMRIPDSVSNTSKKLKYLPDSLNAENNEVHLKASKPQKTSIGFVTAVIVSNSFKRVESEKSKLAFNYAVGLYLQYALSKRIHLEVDALYFEKSKANKTKSYFFFQNNYEIQNENMVFGSLTSITEIETKKLQYFMLPFIVKYAISKKQQVDFGVSFNYLINTKSTITNMSYKNGQLLNTNSMPESGYRNGFKNTTYGILASYNFNIYPNLWAYAQFNLSFDDISKKGYYDSIFNDRLINFRIGIKTQLLNLK